MNSPCVNCGADSRVCKECDWYNGVWISKDQYEARLKADMVAILTEIQLDIEKHTMTSGVTNQFTWNECIACCSRAIQQKINELKAEGEESNHV